MKEKERLKNTFFLRIEQESDSNGRFQKEGTKIENEKKKKNGETENKEDTWKNINNGLFFKNQMVSKKGDTELECKTGVKHNSKQYIFEN